MRSFKVVVKETKTTAVYVSAESEEEAEGIAAGIESHRYCWEDQGRQVEYSRAVNPAFIDPSGVDIIWETREGRRSTTETLEAKILFLLREHDVRDGICHPSEELVAAALKQNPGIVFGIAAGEDAVIRSRALRVIGRAATDPEQVRGVLSQALSDPDLRVRDAAVCAIEELGLLDLLRDHQDHVPWFDKYIKGVLSEEQK